MNTFAAFAPYSVYIDILSRNVPGVLWKVVLVALLGLLFLVSGLFLPALLNKKRKATPETTGADGADAEAPVENSISLTGFFTLSMIGGVGNCLLWWMLSYHLTKSLWPGMIATLPLTFWGIYKSIRNCPCGWGRTNSNAFLVVTLVSLVLGIWHHGPVANEIAPREVTDEKPRIMVPFNDRQGDVAFHVLCAKLIQEHGLPRVNVYGSAFEEYMPLGHVGYSTLIAGSSTLTMQDPFIVTMALWMLSYLLLGWAALACIEHFGLTPDVAMIGGLTPILWGQLGAPNFRLLLNPSTAVNTQGLDNHLAGMQYHNFPQVWSVVFGIGFLYCYQQYQQRDRSLAWWLAAIFSLVLSAWMKPSLAIFLGPALLICMLFNRNGIREWLSLIAVGAAGAAVYFLSGFMAELPRGPRWIFTPSHLDYATDILIEQQWIPILLYFVFGLGAGFIYLYARSRTVFRDLKTRQPLNWADLTLIAAIGSLLFAFLFRESSLNDSIERNQPNLHWGIAATIQIFAIFLTVWFATASLWRDKLRVPNWLRIVAIVLMLVHFLNGFVYAAVYPLLNTRIAFKGNKEVIVAAAELTEPDRRFYLDPAVLTEFVQGQVLPLYDFVPYLEHPVAMDLTISPPDETICVNGWNIFCNSADPEELEILIGYVQFRDAVIIRSSQITAKETLAKHGWTMKAELGEKSKIGEEYELWLQGEDVEIPKLSDVVKAHQARIAEMEAEGEHDHDHDHDHDHGPGTGGKK